MTSQIQEQENWGGGGGGETATNFVHEEVFNVQD